MGGGGGTSYWKGDDKSWAEFYKSVTGAYPQGYVDPVVAQQQRDAAAQAQAQAQQLAQQQAQLQAQRDAAAASKPAPAQTYTPDPGPAPTTSPTGPLLGTGGGIEGPKASGNPAGGLGSLGGALGNTVLKPPQYWVGGLNQYDTPAQSTGRDVGAMKTSNKG